MESGESGDCMSRIQSRDDLISRSAAIIVFTGKPPEYYHSDYIASELRSLPAVDAVPIVRCRNCKFNHGINEECGCNGGHHSEDWYCADGKPRDDDASIFDRISPEWLEKLIDEYTRGQVEEVNFMNESLFPRLQEERIEY